MYLFNFLLLKICKWLTIVIYHPDYILKVSLDCKTVPRQPLSVHHKISINAVILQSWGPNLSVIFTIEIQEQICNHIYYVISFNITWQNIVYY